MPTHTRHNLSAAKIKSLLSKGTPTSVSDGAGLTFTISKTGYAAWVLRFTFQGKRDEVTIGSFDDYPLAKARDAAEQLRRKIAEGTDPAREKKAMKASQEAGDAPSTMIELSEIWYQRKIGPNMVHPHRVKRTLERWVYPKLGKLHPEDVTEGHVVDCIEHTIATGAPTVSNDVRRHIKKILQYGVALGWIPRNVAADITQDIAGYQERPRERYLDLSEIKKLFKTMADNRLQFGRDNELAVRLFLMFGDRKMELVGARWEEFDFDAGLWTIPPERIKKERNKIRDGKPGNKFIMPLPALAIDHLRELQVRACGSVWVFPARRRGKRNLGHISHDTINAALKKLDHGIDHFTIHDFRRTLRTYLSILGVRYEVAELCVNHALKGVAGVYDRHNFLDERRSALQAWADVLTSLDDEGVKAAGRANQSQKVVHLRAAG